MLSEMALHHPLSFCLSERRGKSTGGQKFSPVMKAAYNRRRKHSTGLQRLKFRTRSTHFSAPFNLRKEQTDERQRKCQAESEKPPPRKNKNFEGELLDFT